MTKKKKKTKNKTKKQNKKQNKKKKKQKKSKNAHRFRLVPAGGAIGEQPTRKKTLHDFDFLFLISVILYSIFIALHWS
jgi:hypothetical protein